MVPQTIDAIVESPHPAPHIVLETIPSYLLARVLTLYQQGSTDLAATPGMKMKLIDHGDLAEKMNAKYGKLYSPSKIRAGSYPGYDKDNSITEVWNLIVTNDKMSNEDAYTIVKTLVEKKADIVAVHKEAESFSLDNQVQERSPIPFHPGALKYFKEKGIGG